MSKKAMRSVFVLLFGMAILLVGCGTNGTQPNQANQSNSASQNESANDQPNISDNVEQGEVIKLTLADTFPTTHMMNDVANNVFIKEMESTGKIEIEYYPAEQMGKMEDMIDLVRGGGADIAYIGSGGILGGKMPYVSVLGLPFDFPDNMFVTEVLMEMGNGILAPEFEKQGIKFLWGSAAPGYEILTKDFQVKVPDDIKGKKIRGTGSGGADEALTIFGGSVVTVPTPDIYESFQRGVIDGVSFNYVSGYSYNIHELTKYITEGVNLGAPTTIHAINLDRWNSFSPEIQEIITNASKMASVAAAEGWAEGNIEGKEAFIDTGVEIYQLSESDKEKWEVGKDQAADRWIERLKGQGFNEGENIYSEMIRLVEEKKE